MPLPATTESMITNYGCSTRPTPGPTSLWNTSLFGASGWGRVGASFFAFSTFPPISISSSRGTWARNCGNYSFSSSLT